MASLSLFSIPDLLHQSGAVPTTAHFSTTSVRPFFFFEGAEVCEGRSLLLQLVSRLSHVGTMVQSDMEVFSTISTVPVMEC